MAETSLGAGESWAGSLLPPEAASCLRIQRHVLDRKGTVSIGDAGLAVWQCRRFPAVLLALASLGNKTEIIITLSWISGPGILNIT